MDERAILIEYVRLACREWFRLTGKRTRQPEWLAWRYGDLVVALTKIVNKPQRNDWSWIMANGWQGLTYEAAICTMPNLFDSNTVARCEARLNEI